ncbi:MAG: response regulator [Candidatus Anammoxibacter sp.]
MFKNSRKKTKKKTKKKIRAFIIDDQTMFRDGLAKLINSENDLEVCGEVSDMNLVLGNINDLEPDVVISDIFFKNTSGANLIKNLTTKYPRLPVLVISALDELTYAEIALKSGAKGYIMKENTGKTLITGIRTVVTGKKFISETVVQAMIDKLIGNPAKHKSSLVNELTNREHEILNMVGNGLGTKQITNKLDVSARTIESHKFNIKKKLGLTNSAELIMYALKRNLVINMK